MTTTTLPMQENHTSLSRHRCWFAFLLGPLAIGPLWSICLYPIHPQIGSFMGYILAQLLVVVTVTDLRFRKIPNWATYSAFAWGLALNTVASLFSQRLDVTQLGAVGLGNSLAGGCGLLVVMLAIFSLTGGGAGDVKLSAALGALLGWSQGVDAVLLSFLIGGVCILAYSIWTRGPFFLVGAMFRTLGSIVLRGYVDPPSEQARGILKQRLPLAPFFTLGVVASMFQQHWLVTG